MRPLTWGGVTACIGIVLGSAAAAYASDIPVISPIVESIATTDNIAILVLVLTNLGAIYGWWRSSISHAEATREAVDKFVDVMKEAAAADEDLVVAIEQVRGSVTSMREGQALDMSTLRQIVILAISGRHPPTHGESSSGDD
jgi:hypothetical protein